MNLSDLFKKLNEQNKMFSRYESIGKPSLGFTGLQAQNAIDTVDNVMPRAVPRASKLSGLRGIFNPNLIDDLDDAARIGKLII